MSTGTIDIQRVERIREKLRMVRALQAQNRARIESGEFEPAGGAEAFLDSPDSPGSTRIHPDSPGQEALPRYTAALGPLTLAESARLAEIRRGIEAPPPPSIAPMGVPEPPPDSGPQAADVIAAPPLPEVTQEEAIALRDMRARDAGAQRAIDDAAAREAGWIGRLGAAVRSSVAGGIDSASALMDRALGPGSRGAPTGDQIAASLLLQPPADPEEGAAIAAIGQRADLPSQAAAGLLALPAMAANPLDAAIMGVPGVPGASPLFGAARRLGDTLAQRFGAGLGRRAEQIIADLASSGSGLAAFSAASAGMNYPAWETDPEGGIRAMADAGTHGAQMGLLFGGAHAAKRLRGMGPAQTRPPVAGRGRLADRPPEREPSLAEIDAEVGQTIGQQRAAAETARAIEAQARLSEQRRVERETALPEWDDAGYRAGLGGEDINARIPTDPASARAMAAGYARGIEERFGIRRPDRTPPVQPSSPPLYQPSLRERATAVSRPEPVARPEPVPTAAGSPAARLRAASGAPADVGALPPSARVPLPPPETMRQADYVAARMDRDGADMRDWAPGEHLRAVRIALERGERPVGMADYPDLARRYASPEPTRGTSSDQGRPAPVLDRELGGQGAAAADAAAGGAGAPGGAPGRAAPGGGEPAAPARPLDPVEGDALRQLIRAPQKGEWSRADLDRRTREWADRAESQGPTVDLEQLDRLRVESGEGESGGMEGGAGEGGTAQAFDTKFRGPVPADLARALQHAPHLRMHVKGNQKWGNGADALARMGLDRYVQTLEQLVAGKDKKLAEARALARSMAEHDPAAAFVAYVRESLPAVQRERPRFDVMDTPGERLPIGAEFTINGERVRIELDDGFKMLVDDAGNMFHLEAIDSLPIDRGSLRFPRRTPEEAAALLETTTDPLERAVLAKEAEGAKGGGKGGDPDAVQEGQEAQAEVLSVPDFAADVAADEAAKPAKGADLSRQLDLGGREVGPVTGKQQQLPLPEPSKLEREVQDMIRDENDPDQMQFPEGKPPDSIGATNPRSSQWQQAVNNYAQAKGFAPTTQPPAAAIPQTGPQAVALGAAQQAASRSPIAHAAASVVGHILRPGSPVRQIPATMHAIADQLGGIALPRLTRMSEAASAEARTVATVRDWAEAESVRMGTEVFRELGGIAPKNAEFMQEVMGVVVEDRLRGTRNRFIERAFEARQKGDAAAEAKALTAAGNVKTMVKGQPNSLANARFADENAYLDAYNDTNVQLALRGIDREFVSVNEPLFKEAMKLDPGAVLEQKGEFLPFHVSLRPIDPNEAPRRFMGGARGEKALLRRKSRKGWEASGAAEAYDLDPVAVFADTLHENARAANIRSLYDTLKREGIGEETTYADRPKLVKGEEPATLYIENGRMLVHEGTRATSNLPGKVLSVPASIVGELRRAIGASERVSLFDSEGARRAVNALTWLVNALTWLNLNTGWGDNVAVTIATFRALLNSPFIGRTAADRVAGHLGPLRALSVAASWAPEVYKIARSEPATMRRLSELARLGVFRDSPIPRPMGAARRALRYVWPVLGQARALNDFLHLHIKATALSLDSAYTWMAKNLPGVENTPTARAQFIERALGQYHHGLQSKPMAALRESGVSPFVTLGITGNREAVRGMLGSHNVRGGFAARQALRLAAIGPMAGTAASIAVWNYMVSGSPLGRPGVPLLSMDLGTDDKEGKPRYLDPMGWFGVRRGLRALGLTDVAQSVKEGEARFRPDQLANEWSRPFIGPAIKSLITGATGYDTRVAPGMRPQRAAPVVPPGESQLLSNVRTAAEQSVQVVPDFKEGGVAGVATGTLAPFLPRSGRRERDITSQPRRIHAAQLNEYIDDQVQRIKAMPHGERAKAMREAAKKLDPTDWPKFYREMESRRVLVP